MNVVELKNISFAYNHNQVLDNISFAIEASGFAGIIGPNGAGKSTLLRIIGRILTRYQGELIVMNKDIKEIKPKDFARLVGFVPQETHFQLNYLVEDIIAMGRYPYQRPFQRLTKDDMEAINLAMEQARLSEFKTRPVNSLSSGERQRVVIARALAQQPKILLLDEPTSYLDLHHQHLIMELLKSLNNQGIVIILVQHDVNLASLYCQRLIMLQHGKIYAQGTPRSLLNEKTIKEVYQTEVKIIHHPDKQIPQIFFK